MDAMLVECSVASGCVQKCGERGSLDTLITLRRRRRRDRARKLFLFIVHTVAAQKERAEISFDVSLSEGILKHQKKEQI